MKKDMKREREQALKLHQKGLSLIEIAHKLKRPYGTVYNWLVRRNPANREAKTKKRESKTKEYISALRDSALGEKLEEYLMKVWKVKGKERVGSLYLFYRQHKEELAKVLGRKIGKSRFYSLVNVYVTMNFGSVAKLELKRRPKSAFKHIVKAGTIKREKGLWEIDGTGYTFQDRLYAILLCYDTYSGYVIDALWVEAKENNQAKHYNKAFNSQQIGAWLQKVFIEHGVPEKLRYDNDKVLMSEYLKEAFKSLKIDCKRTKPYSPHHKLVERAIGSLKEYLQIAQGETFQEVLQNAIYQYNKDQHNFKHCIIRPIELFTPGKKIDEETIRFAFAEKFERVLTNSVIQIENLKYECPFIRERVGDTGRLEKGKDVLCVRYIDDVSKLEVYDKETGEFLGTAKLVTLVTLQKISSAEIKESIAKTRRAQKRLAKLEEEATLIKGQIQPQGVVAVFSNGNKSNGTTLKEKHDDLLPGLLEIFGQ